MKLINRIFSSFEARLVPPRLSLWRTLYFNLRTLPLNMAMRFPIYIYGRVHFPMLAGEVSIIYNRITSGMIRIGRQDPFSVTTGNGFISIAPSSKIEFNGPCDIGANCAIRLLDGTVVFGRFSYLGSEVTIICNGKSIRIGDYTRIAYQTLIINSSFHSVVNLLDNMVLPHIKYIEIGCRNWIGNRSTIAGGTILKDNTIVAAGSYVNKNFKQQSEDYQMIGGRPAKLLKYNVRRVFSFKLEKRIISYFKNNPDKKYYYLDNLIELD